MMMKNILNNQPMMMAVCRQGKKLKPMGDIVREAEKEERMH
jgi:hypothetical protein